MANAITLAKVYQPLLDEVFKMGSKTAMLEAPSSMIRETASADTVLIPKIVLDGLGDYDRNLGFTAGSATLTWETHQFTQDRGRSFSIDDSDDDETLNVAFSAVTSQFVRTKVVPEVDAYRFAVMATKAGTKVAAALTANQVLPAIDVARQKLIESECELENVILFIAPAMYTILKQDQKITRQFVGGNIQRDIESLDGMAVVQVPQTRFYSEITMYDGKTAGQEAGSYIKTAVTGKDINFMLVDTNSVVAITKTALPRIFDPMTNQTANAWKFDYRLYHDIFVPDNKVNGVYLHTVA